MTENFKCCFTGYRPSKMPFSIDGECGEYKEFENNLIDEILKLINEGCTVFYSGMAMGFDIIAAETVLFLKKVRKDKDIRLICVLPFIGQEEAYDYAWKERFYNLLAECDDKVILSESYFQGCYQKRNEFMVDNSDFVLTWYDGKAGGTRNTLNYATRKKRQIININNNDVEGFGVQMTFELL